jgi:hypothetical protein
VEYNVLFHVKQCALDDGLGGSEASLIPAQAHPVSRETNGSPPALPVFPSSSEFKDPGSYF